MAPEPSEDSTWDDRRIRWFVGLALTGLAVLFIAGLVAVFVFAQQARQRDLDQWRLRLAIVAQSRAEAVADWLHARAQSVQDIAANPSVRLYLTEISGDQPGPAAGAQARYLQNLLSATAAQAGFEARTGASTVPANVDRPATAGLAIVGGDGRIVAQSGTLSRADNLGHLFRRRAVIREDRVGGDLVVSVGAPIFAVQDDPESDAPLGWVVGLAPAGPELAARLVQPGLTAETARSYLVSPPDDDLTAENGEIAHPGPLREGSEKKGLTIPNPAAQAAIRAPGRMVAARDYRGERVLAVAAEIPSPIGWWVMHSIDAGEALGAINARRTRLIIILSLGLVVLTALVLLAWRHGASVRLSRSARRLGDLADRHEQLSRFLRTVTDNQPTEILALDRQLRCRFANRRACDTVGLREADMRGKSLEALYGPAAAAPMVSAAQKALGGEPASLTLDGDGEDGVFRLHQIPLQPPADGAVVLMVREDITELVAAQRARQSALDATVETLVTLIDARDRYAAAHSKRVAAVASDIADCLDLDTMGRETVRYGALLLNIGKLMVPRSLLTRSSELTEEEMQGVHAALGRGAELLAHVDFGGPVVETLRQVWWHEEGDPAGEQGESRNQENDLLAARILIVANAFVGMISPRSYRPAIPMDKAVSALMAEAGGRYDRGVVAALVHHMDNEGGRDAWGRFAEMPDMPIDQDIA